jgi:hypothetical protein
MKIAGLAAAVLKALAYTWSRTVVKTTAAQRQRAAGHRQGGGVSGALATLIVNGVTELGEAIAHKLAGHAKDEVKAELEELLAPIRERISSLEADLEERLAGLGMLLATTAAADGAAGVVKAFEPKGTLPTCDGADVHQLGRSMTGTT